MRQYKVEKLTNMENLEEHFNEMAEEGWEVVSHSYWKDFFPYLLITYVKEKSAE